MKKQLLILCMVLISLSAYTLPLLTSGLTSDKTGAGNPEISLSGSGSNSGSKVSAAESKAIIKECTKSLLEDPKNPELYFRRANAYLAVKDYEGAIEDFNMGLRYDPKNAEVYFNRATAKMYMGDYHGATSDFSRTIRNNPGDKEAYYNRAWCNIHNMKTQAAIQDFNNIIRLDPEDADAFYNRGNLRYELKDFKGACIDWGKAAPNHAEAAKILKKYCK